MQAENSLITPIKTAKNEPTGYITTDVALWFELSHVDGLILRSCVCSRFHVQTTAGVAMITDVVMKLKLYRSQMCLANKNVQQKYPF